MVNFETKVGIPYPYGACLARIDGVDGVNFCIFSRNATRIAINLYKNQNDAEAFSQIVFNPKENRTGDNWHIFVPGLTAGTLYLYQIEGPFDLTRGHRFNGKQLVFDPYAKALTCESVFLNLPRDYKPVLDKTDFELFKGFQVSKFPKCVVVDNNDFDWQGDKPLNRKMSEQIIYEVHLKGFTAGKNAGVQFPGTYIGFIEKIPYLKHLGITAVEFLPIFEFDENENGNINPRTGERLKNFWGYSTMQFFCPKASYASDKRPGGAVHEFKTLVRELHKAGIEVILDVVFNHTAEGNEHGVTLSFRGIENSVYYMLVGNHKEYYMNFSGCGNTLNCNHPVVRKFILDCLEYWVLEYHIDGFRFDLASVLSRNQEGQVLQMAPLTNAISEDPILRNTKIIAEPWDAGGAYQLGAFPGERWCEWNDRYRDDIRRFWRGDEHVSTGAATRISGSSDLFASSGRKPWNSINYVCCHDGFTMNDLVSYNGKHNEENGEGNRDGSDSNWSYNNGYEGGTANPQIERTRNRQMRNYILTELISQGTPMILAGDEFRRGQQGNNNAYCQDNDISWVDWNNCNLNKNLVSFTKRAIELRKRHPVFRREEFFSGKGDIPDIQWYNKDCANPDWNKISKFLAFRLGGKNIPLSQSNIENQLNRANKSNLQENSVQKICDNDFFIAANADRTDCMVKLPTPPNGKKWYRIADTSIESEDSILSDENAEKLPGQERYVLPANSLVVLMAK